MLETILIAVPVAVLVTGLVASGYFTARTLYRAVRDRNVRAYRGKF